MYLDKRQIFLAPHFLLQMGPDDSSGRRQTSVQNGCHSCLYCFSSASLIIIMLPHLQIYLKVVHLKTFSLYAYYSGIKQAAEQITTLSLTDLAGSTNARQNNCTHSVCVRQCHMYHQELSVQQTHPLTLSHTHCVCTRDKCKLAC